MIKEEYFPLVDEQGNETGQASRKECHSGSMLLHPVVHLHVFNTKGELYLQKRASTKDIQPGKWDTAVGGHIDFGETIEEALRREVREELGIIEFVSEFCYQYIWSSSIERELVYTFRTMYEGVITPDPSELEDGHFWTLPIIEQQIGKDVFTPNFEKEFALLKQYHLV